MIVTCSINYFANDELIGSCDLRCEEYNVPYSMAFICTTCGNVWGRCVVNDGTKWDCLTTPCENHRPHHNGDNNNPPGSLLCPGRTMRFAASHWWSAILDFMPRPVLEREFLLAMRYRDERGDL